MWVRVFVDRSRGAPCQPGEGMTAGSTAATRPCRRAGGDRRGAVQLYGCDVALGEAGQQFIDDVSALAGGVTVEAATHLVRDAADGGC